MNLEEKQVAMRKRWSRSLEALQERWGRIRIEWLPIRKWWRGTCPACGELGFLRGRFRPEEEGSMTAVRCPVCGHEYDEARSRKIKAGVRKAREEGRFIGRPPKAISAEDYASIAVMRESGESLRSIAEKLGLSKSTVYRYAKPGFYREQLKKEKKEIRECLKKLEEAHQETAAQMRKGHPPNLEKLQSLMNQLQSLPSERPTEARSRLSTTKQQRQELTRQTKLRPQHPKSIQPLAQDKCQSIQRGKRP